MTKYYLQDEDGKFVETKALSQDEVDTVVQDRLKRQAEKFADYEDLKSKAKSVDELTAKHNAELAELKTQLEAANAATKAAELATTRQKLLRDYNIKESLADFVTGSNEDELRAKAEKLSKELPTDRLTFQKEDNAETKKGLDPSVRIANSLFGDSE